MAQQQRYAPLARSWLAAYGFAVLIGLGSIVVARLVEFETGGEPIYALLVAGVAISVWYGGARSGLVTLAIGWLLAPLVLYPDRSFSFTDRDELDRWGVGCVAALAVVWVSLVMRRGQQRAATAADVATMSSERMERLQQLAAGLSTAASPAEIANVIMQQATVALGAQGAILARAEGDALEVADSVGLGAQAHVAGKRLALERATMVTHAARDGTVVRVDDRASLAASFADSAQHFPPSVEAALAIPLYASGEVVGVVEFLYERRDSLDDETVATVKTVARLVEQALERARLYELERKSRQALDRILRVAPRFHAETAQEVTAAICREARATFGADYGVLWRLRDSELVLLNSDPLRDELPQGLRVPLDDFSGLAEAVETHAVSFTPDVLLEARREGLERVRGMGIRSSLRSPIVIGAEAELVLAVSWRSVISEPDPSTVVLMRRFADQAGLALEQLERRRAEAEAARLLEEERLRRVRSERLQRTTAALSNALTPNEVAEVVVEVLCDELEPDAASVSAVVEERAALKALAWRGYSDELTDDEVSLDAETPEAQALRRPGWRLFTSQDAEPGVEPTGSVSYAVAPLVFGRRRIGVLAVSWSTPFALRNEDRAFIETLASQAALALDRARVFESERTTAETLQRSVLPASLPRVEGVKLAARYLPGTQGVLVGGDWFDALELHDGRLGLVVGDVMGKGVQAAASMSQLRNALRAFSVERLKPSSTLARLDLLGDKTLEAAFATVVYAVLDPRNGLVRFSSAGHPPPLIAYVDGRVELLEDGRGLPLGTGMRPQYRQAVAEIPAGSVLVLYSDGLVERRGESIDDGLQRLVAAVRGAPKDPERLLEAILHRVIGDEPRADDIALLAARLLPVAPQPLELRLPPTMDALPVVREALRAWTDGVPLGRAESEGLVLATWEASANAVEHAVDAADGPVLVRATLADSKIRITIEDNGRWAPPDNTAGRGLGLQLMRALASVDIAPGGSRGTRVTIEYDITESTADAALRTAR